MFINGQEYESYEDYCEEVMAYMRCQNESFDFGEGDVKMSETGGEYAMYKFNILHYLNTFYDDDYHEWLLTKYKDDVDSKLEYEFDIDYYEKLNNKLQNRHNRKLKYSRRNRRITSK